MKTWALTWFPWCRSAETMSTIERQQVKSLESQSFQEIQRLKYIVTIPHDWLVKRVFVYIIEKRKVIKLMVVEFTRHGQRLN